jgi:4-hydroxy-tetrahydrodipicolinate synthase
MVAMPTPMNASGSVDLSGTARLAEWLIAKGIDGMLVCGTTGEGPLLDDDERVAVVRAAVTAAAGQVPVIGQVGAATTARTVDLARRCVEAGADALAVVTPHFFRYHDEELIMHYSTVARAVSDRAVLAYSIPALTGNAVTPAVLRGLRGVSNIIGMKDSTGDEYGLVQLAEAGGPGFQLIVGADLLSLQVLAMGWAGIISGPASAIPEPFVALWRTASDGDWPAVAAAYRQVVAANHALRNGGDVPRIKGALAVRGVIGPHLRAPLRPLTDGDLADLRKVLDPLVGSPASPGRM